ncbi:MAG: class I adenylate-forming enzyme family protein [Acidimicrobiales bacterium]
MNIAMLIEMAADGGGERLAVGELTYDGLLDHARRAATWFTARDAQTVALVGVSSAAFPIALWGAALAGLPFAPVNYRWDDGQLRRALSRLAPVVVVADDDAAGRIEGLEGVDVVGRSRFLAEVAATEPTMEPPPETERPAVLLFTSGTSGDPKVAVLTHDNLVSYIFGTVEFMGGDPDEVQLVSVPPYHIAGIANLLSCVYAGRRIIQLPTFEPDVWIDLVRSEGVTHAMVVPTMLARVLETLDGDLPSLRHLSYGGGRMPLPVIESAVTRLPEVAFVNAYGLTETSSTVAVLSPNDHRDALASDNPLLRRRLTSVGRPLPSIEVSIRDLNGVEVDAGDVGEIWVRGEQVSGAYVGVGSVCDPDGWFPTKDGGFVDEGGYLFVEGRLDDVIVRGGENISPGEVEDVLVAHPDVVDAAVIGVPDVEWGEMVAAAVVLLPGASTKPEDLQAWVRDRLRSSKTPSRIEMVEALPYNDNGKLLRRELRAAFTPAGS